jgi:hypothetical protein
MRIAQIEARRHVDPMKMRVPMIALLVLAACSLNGFADESKRVLSGFVGKELPLPPHQRDKWQPAAGGVPALWNDAARVLFEQGLPDPRGCEYRELEVVTGRLTPEKWIR